METQVKTERKLPILLEALILTVGNVTSGNNGSACTSGKPFAGHLEVRTSGVGVQALETIVPRSPLTIVVGSAGSRVSPFVDVAGVVAHKVPAPGEAGGEGVRQVAVGGEGA